MSYFFTLILLSIYFDYMFAGFIVTLRETLEAALIVGITLGYLNKTGQSSMKKVIWAGVAAGVAASLLGAVLFNTLLGGFEGRAEELFEGIVMLVGAALITTVVLWMIKERGRIGKFKDKLETHVTKGQKTELFFLVFIAVLREGIETVIFLQAVSAASGANTFSGAVVGIVVAIVLGLLLYKGSLKLPLKKFFTVTSVLLILFAAGLVAHGIHELQEANVVPIVAEHIWDINPEVVEEGVYPALHEKGSIGGLMKGLFGYNGNPNLLEVLGYIVYILVIAAVWKKLEKGNSPPEPSSCVGS